MNYDFAVISSHSAELDDFLANPTERRNLLLLFTPPPNNESIYMCLIRRRYEGWKRSQFYDLYLQFGGFPIFLLIMNRVNKYLITAHRKESGLHSIICLSIPHDPSSVEPLSNHTHEKDQLSIGSVKSNCANTTYYVTIDESVIQDLHNTQLIDMNELLVKYKLNRFSSWKPYEMKIYLKTPLCYTENSYPSMNVLSSKPPQWDPTVL